MSSPRYDWWSYVKGMIRRYPELCARQKELRRTKMSPNLTGMPGAHGQTSDPVADAALRELPEINRRELEAVRQAIEETRALPNGEERLEMVKLVFWKKTHPSVCRQKSPASPPHLFAQKHADCPSTGPSILSKALSCRVWKHP